MEYCEEDIKNHLELYKKYGTKQPKPENPQPVGENLSLIDQTLVERTPSRVFEEVLSKEYIESLLLEFGRICEGFELSKKNTVVKKKLASLKTPFELYFKAETLQEEGEGGLKKRKLHNLFSKMESVFTPEASILYELNSTEKLMKKVDDNLKEYKVIQTQRSEDGSMILQLVLMVTKRVLIVQSKSFLTIRICKKMSDEKYIVVGESVLRNGLRDVEEVKKIQKKMVNECEIFLNGTRYTETEKGCMSETLSKGDFKTKTGAVVLKPIFKKSFSKYYNNYVKEFVNFVIRGGHDDKKTLIWFEQRDEEICRIFERQRKILLEKMREDPEIFDKKWVEELKELETQHIRRGSNERREMIGECITHGEEGELEKVKDGVVGERGLECPLVKEGGSQKVELASS
jgi:hypothetical protein